MQFMPLKEFELLLYIYQMECAICLQEIQLPEAMNCCRNTFCTFCLKQWLQVRNCCPLCLATTDHIPHNHLQTIMSRQFDPVWLQIQTELANIQSKAVHLTKSLEHYQRLAGLKGNGIPMKSLLFVKRQMEFMWEDISTMKGLCRQDQQNSVVMLQEMVGRLLEVEDVLNGNCGVQYESGSEYSESESESEEDQPYRVKQTCGNRKIR